MSAKEFLWYALLGAFIGAPIFVLAFVLWAAVMGLGLGPI